MYHYVVRARGRTFVWGSSDLKIVPQHSLILVINNDAIGDAVELSSEGPGSTPTVLGTLRPGECWSLPLIGLHGVVATCATDTTLACSLLPQN